MSNDIFNFNFLALVLSEILGGPKFTLGGLRFPEDPKWKNFEMPTSTCLYLNIIVDFQLRSSINAGLTERSLYNRFCIEWSPKMGFWGFWRKGLKYLVGTR